ncbi:MAG: hypothetical protein HY776_07440 [Actinobacteria bacterium]|nr:hypothetical protein [Actinomycetota bacterium]
MSKRAMTVLISLSSALFGIVIVFYSSLFLDPETATHVVIRDIGIAVIIAGIVPVVFERLLLMQASEEITKEFKDHFDPVSERLEGLTDNLFAVKDDMSMLVEEGLQIINGAEKSGIVNIYPVRSASGGSTASFEKVIAEILTKKRGEEISEIVLGGIALNEFFGGERFYHTIEGQCLKDANVQYKVLLLDPFSLSARERAIAEENDEGYGEDPKFRNSQLYLQIKSSVHNLKAIKDRSNEKKNKRFNIEARFYDVGPMAYFVIGREWLLIEQYHSGQAPGRSGSMGGHIPILQVKANSSFYERIRWHSDYLWKRAEKKDRTLDVVYKELFEGEVD